MGRRRTAPIVCSIGSTDPTGAAGLMLDARVYARLGAAAAYVVTGVTAQNSSAVDAVSALPPGIVRAQLRAVWRQVRPNAVRIGLIPTSAAMRAVGQHLRGLQSRPPVVFNPVIAASSGYVFLDARALAAIRSLMRLSTIVTLNAVEAGQLCGFRVRDVADAERAAAMLASGAGAVLVTGGHLRGARSIDVLAVGGTLARYGASRLHPDVRGTGCMLAASLAVALARGDALQRAVTFARAFVRRSMKAARPLGSGRAQMH